MNCEMGNRGISIVVVLAALALAVSAQAQSFLILPFENVGKDSRSDWMGVGLAELSAGRIAGDGRVVLPREEWQTSLEKLGLPSSARFSRATMIKIAEEVDADYIVFGSFASDGKKLTATARILQIDPPGLSAALVESGPLEELLTIHGRLAWRVLKSVDAALPEGQRSRIEASDIPRLDAFEQYVRGLAASDEPQRLRFLREAARLAPEWTAPAFALGQAYLERRDCASAFGWFARVPLGGRNGPEAAFYAGVCHLQRNDPVRAETAFATLLQRVAVAEGFHNLGVALARQDRWREAAAQWQQAQKLDPDEPDYWFHLGLAAMKNNEPGAAVRPLREALRRRPQDDVASALLITALERSARAAEAAAEREASSGSALTVLPSPRMKTKLSAPVLAEGTRRAPAAGHRATHARLHALRGDAALKVGRLDEAEREFAEAVMIDPLAPEAHAGLAQVYHRQGRAEDAVREYRAALWGRDDAALRVSLARLFLEQKRSAEARTELRAALKLDPANREARALLDSIERSTGVRK
jgi:tetratricopeptide (TPR) repeat protein/TolB-like protein